MPHRNQNVIDLNPNTITSPNYTRRRIVGGVAVAAAAAVAFVGGNKLLDRVQGTHPVQENVPVHTGDRVYTVKANDTLSDIAHRAHPEMELYSDQFKAELAKLARQLPENDQYLGTVHPGEKIVLDDGSNIGQPER